MSTVSYRIISSKFPPISLFDDVADQAEFEALYALQALTNPRIQNEIGNLNLLPNSEIPFGITGCSYAAASFTHVNPDGSRFSDGQFGVFYVADEMKTAIREVRHHQNKYWKSVTGFKYERLVFRGLRCTFDDIEIVDATLLSSDDPIYSQDDYSASRNYGISLKKKGKMGIKYNSVRAEDHTCWALFSPKYIASIVQTSHYEFVWNGSEISAVNKITTVLRDAERA